MKLLHIDSSLLGEASVSRRLTASLVARWQAAHPDLTVTYRDLAATPPAHCSATTLGGNMRPADEQSAAEREERALTDTLIDEFLAADVLVIGAPMYNFSVPSQLKAWIDRIAVAGRTFRYSETGPVGLAGGKTVVIASSRGGVYSTGSRQDFDFQEQYLRKVFAFLGITELQVIRAEGLNLGPEARQSALGTADQAIAELFPRAA